MTLTVGELRKQLAALPDDTKIDFAGKLSFNRLRYRQGRILVEFEEIEAMLSDEFKFKHPEVKAIFCSFESDDSPIEPVELPIF